MTSKDLSKTLRYRHFIFGILGIGYVIVYFHRLCPAVLAKDIMRDLNASGPLIGVLGSAYFYPYALMQLPAGLLSDSWGARKSVSSFLLIAFIGSMILAAAPDALWAIIGRVLVGLGVSVLFVPFMKVMSEWYTTREFAFMSGIIIAIGGVGSLASATPLAWMSSLIGWRMSFASVGIATLIIGALIWRIVRDRPADLGWPSPEVHIQKEGPAIGLWEGVKRVFSHPPFWVVAVWIFFNVSVFFALGGLWGGPYLMEVYHLSKAGAGHVLSMLSIGLIIGSPILSFLSNRVLKGRKPVLVLCSLILMPLMYIMYVFVDKIPMAMLYVIFLAIGIFSGSVVAVGFTMAKELFPVSIAGTSIGLINIFPFLGGALFQPFLGYVLERNGRVNDAFTLRGYQQVMLIFFLSSLIALIAGFFTRETVKRQ